MSHEIVKRNYYAIKLSLCSPLAVSGGEGEWTDRDVFRNSRGEVMIPGTSVAGAFRNYLEKKKYEDCCLGYSREKEGRMSSIFISDIYLSKGERAENKNQLRVSVRDGVQLSDRKEVENKFDMEIVETGAEGVLYLSEIVREGNQEADIEKEIARLILAIEKGEIRFGSSKNRGFGKLKPECVYHKTFTKEECSAWIRFAPLQKDLTQYETIENYQEWLQKRLGEKGTEDKYYQICLPLHLQGGISIRRYSAISGKADYEHLTCNGKPVIPGSSWCGAIRSDAKELLMQMGASHARAAELLEMWFGRADGSWQSAIVVGESIIEGASAVPVARNKIDRFDNSAVEGALYSELAYYGGQTKLEIMVRKDAHGYDCALLALLEFVLQDICNGYVAVGGQTAIGRGVLEGCADGILCEEIRRQGQSRLIDLLEERRTTDAV